MSKKVDTHICQDKLKVRQDGTEPFHHGLRDVALYSLGGLCAISLVQLFDDEHHRDFRRRTLEKILKDLGQPSQTNESMFAILDGEIMDDGSAFVDTLLADKHLQGSRHPIIMDLVALAISEGCYDARVRVLVKHLAWQLRVSWDTVEAIETELSETLEYNIYVMSEEERNEKEKKAKKSKFKRFALIGLATVGGGAIIGLTGGLAAPLVAAGAGAIIGTAGAAALGSTAGVAIIGSLFGVAGAGLGGYKMKKRFGAVEEFAFEPLTLIGSKFDPKRSVKQLHVTIAVTGWLNGSNSDFRVPWSALAESREQYSLRWESKYLQELGEAFEYILQTGVSVATTEALKYTILSGLITAIAWPAALISAAGVIDNPWHVCTQRATEAGKQLAEVLLAREQGNRPVTLIGFSMGARVVFSCLEELSKRKGSDGIIEDAILLGAPVSADAKQWSSFGRVIAGKIVNGYARGDWLLKFLYRTASVTMSVAGLGPVKWSNRRMHNIDLSDVIDGHGDYSKHLPLIMKAVGIRTKDELRPKLTRFTSLQRAKVDKKHADDEGKNIDLEHTEASGTTEECPGNSAEAKPSAKTQEEIKAAESADHVKVSSTTETTDNEHDIKPKIANSDTEITENPKSVSEDSGVYDSGTDTSKAVVNEVLAPKLDDEISSESDTVTSDSSIVEDSPHKTASGIVNPPKHSARTPSYKSTSGPENLSQNLSASQSGSCDKAEADSDMTAKTGPINLADSAEDGASHATPVVMPALPSKDQKVLDPMQVRADYLKVLPVYADDGAVHVASLPKSESCYFTDSNPTSEDEDEEDSEKKGQ